MRQERIKLLAAQADAKWAAKPSALDAPDKQQPVQPLQSVGAESAIMPMNVNHDIRNRAAAEPAEPARPTAHNQPSGAPAPTSVKKKPKKEPKKEPKDSPWNQPSQSQDWQPQGWTPAPAKRRT